MSPAIEYGPPRMIAPRVQWRSAQPAGRSTYGFRCDCFECGAILEIRIGSSVTAEDAPRSFVASHSDCAHGRPFAVAPVARGSRIVWEAVSRREASARARQARNGYVGPWYPAREHGPVLPPIRWVREYNAHMGECGYGLGKMIVPTRTGGDR